MKYELTQHARDGLTERHIPVEWMERELAGPELKVPDDPGVDVLRILFRDVPIEESENEIAVVTLYKTSKLRKYLPEETA